MHRSILLTGLLVLFAVPAHAQEPAAPGPLPEAVATQFQERIDELDRLYGEIDVLEAQMEGAEGLLERVFAGRLESIRTALFDNTLKLAQDVAEQQENGFDVAAYAQMLEDDLRVFPEQAMATMDRLSATIEFDYSEMGPRETVVNDKRLASAIERLDAVLEALVSYTEVAERMGIDATTQVEFLTEKLQQAGANRSVFLDVALEQFALAKSSAAALPDDEELPLWIAATEARIATASAALQSIINLMNRVGMDTRRYRQQIVTATGELTADVLDVGVAAGIVSQWTQAMLDFTRSEGPRLLFRVLIVLAILFVFAWLGKLVRMGVERALSSSRVRLSNLLKRMIVSTARNLTIFLGILFALSQIGISLGPLLAGLGIAGFIIGFALQDTLANFASGMMILVYRPFDVGDFVSAGGVTGRVDNMSLVNTTFKTLDNQVIVVPNNLIWQQVITNVTAQKTRRVDLTFGIAYEDDIDKAKEVLEDVVAKHEACLDDPAPVIRVAALGESSVDLICRPWVRTEDYWETYWSLTETVKKRFDEAGITIPFPQRTLHMMPQPAGES